MSHASSSTVSNRTALSAAVKGEAQRLGFELCGICPAVGPTGLTAFHDWLGRGYAGEMSYLPNRSAAYEHPSGVLESVRSVVMLALNYRTSDPPSTVRGQARDMPGARSIITISFATN
jgi:epoxyqueuosine reductase